MEEKPLLNISEEVQGQIRHFCHRIDKVEWSGVVFYTTNGNYKDMSKLEVNVVDIMLLSIDTAGTTSYQEYKEDRLMDYIMENPGLQRGTIHSHHTMSAFFSGTDLDDLAKNSIGADFYLSIIVNNAGSIIAKMTRVGQLTSKFKSFDSEFEVTYGAKHALVYDMFLFKKSYPELDKLIEELKPKYKPVEKKVNYGSKNDDYVIPTFNSDIYFEEKYGIPPNKRESTVSDLFDDVNGLLGAPSEEDDDDYICGFIEQAMDYIEEFEKDPIEDVTSNIGFLFEVAFHTSIKAAPERLIKEILSNCYQYGASKVVKILSNARKEK